MLRGDKAEFAIEIFPRRQIEEQVFGQFFMHVGGHRLGDPSDQTLLEGCRNWLRDLDADAPMRREPQLDNCDAEDVLRLAWDDVMASSGVDHPRFPSAFRRFHIAHVGMSAFDRFDVLLMLTSTGKSRFVWRHNGGLAHEHFVGQGVTRRVVAATVLDMNRLFGA